LKIANILFILSISSINLRIPQLMFSIVITIVVVIFYILYCLRLIIFPVYNSVLLVSILRYRIAGTYDTLSFDIFGDTGVLSHIFMLTGTCSINWGTPTTLLFSFNWGTLMFTPAFYGVFNVFVSLSNLSFYFLAELGFEVRASHLLGRYSTTWAAPLAFFCDGFFEIVSH
jgi:hypothetical protein